MRRRMKLGILILILQISPLWAVTFYGTVRDARTHFTLYQVKVRIEIPAWDIVDSTYTNAGGRWMFETATAAASDQIGLPKTITVLPNYPNPFNPETQIPFSIPENGPVTFTVWDIRGHQVENHNWSLQSGTYGITWASKGPSGVYLFRIRTTHNQETRKMIQLDGGGNAGGFQSLKSLGDKINANQLLKATETTARIITSKIGYLNDTTDVIIEEGADYLTYLESVHDWAVMIDLHNDVLERLTADPDYHLADRHTYNHTDIPRLRDGGVDIQWFSVWISPTSYPTNPFNTALTFIDRFQAEVTANPTTLGMATTLEQALALNAEGKIAGVFGVEGGHTIENSLDNLQTLYDLGMRYLTITWNNSTDWAVSAQDSRSDSVGLSDFGRQVIHKLDSLGVIIDVSHTGIQTIRDILDETQNPIIASHSGVRALRDHYRNLYDDQIQAIANSGGVVGIVFYKNFLANPGQWVSVNTVIQHIDYIVNLVGIDYVAIGSDFDGVGQNSVPSGLEDTSKYPNLTIGLLNHGYSPDDVRKILGGNFMRVFQTVCGENPAGL